MKVTSTLFALAGAAAAAPYAEYKDYPVSTPVSHVIFKKCAMETDTYTGVLCFDIVGQALHSQPNLL
jgi:hypothetical protein